MYISNHDYMMGPGYSLRDILNEADGDPNTAAPEEDDTGAMEDTGGDPNTGDNDEATGGDDSETDTTDDTGDSSVESPEDTGDEEDTGEDNGDENFNIDAEDDTGDDEATDDTGDDSSSDDPNAESDDTEEDEEIDPNSLKALDGKLYEDLSPAEQKLKIRQLKQLYTELFYKCASISEKLNSIFVEDDEATLQIKMAGSMVFNLKQMISDYFLNIFESKSYQENDVMFNRYLAMMDQVKRLTDELKKMYFSDSE